MLPKYYQSVTSQGAPGPIYEILRRDATAMVGEVIIGPGVPNTFTTITGDVFVNQAAAVVEIHEMIPRAVLVDTNDNPLADPVPDINAWWRIQVTLTQSNNAQVVRGNQRVLALLDAETKTWKVSGRDQAAPYYFPNKYGWQVSAASLIPTGGNDLAIDVSLMGYSLTLGEAIARADWLDYQRTRLPELGIGTVEDAVAPFAPFDSYQHRPR